MIDFLKVLSQYLLPHFAITKLMLWLTHSNVTAWNKLFIRRFARHYNVDMSQAENSDLDSYRNFNQFFTRPLKPEARPICTSPAEIACPVDGSISQLGDIENETIFQAKGHSYSLQQLLANQAPWVNTFQNGKFATIYLSPRDYHRIHMPFTGTLQQMTYVPGKLFSVSPVTTRNIPALFARNERVLCFFETANGPMAVILVGAMIVGSMETVWHGMVTPPHGKQIKHFHYPPSGDQPADTQTIKLDKGMELGRFNMGSTVILLFAKQAICWDDALAAGAAVKMGTSIATFTKGVDRASA